MEENQSEAQIENKMSMMKKIINFLKMLEEISHVEDNWWGKRIRFLKAIQLPCLAVLFHWFAMSHIFVFLGGVLCRDGWSTIWTVRGGYLLGFIQLFMINLSVMWFIMPPAYQEELPGADASETKTSTNPQPATRGTGGVTNGTPPSPRRFIQCPLGHRIEVPRVIRCRMGHYIEVPSPMDHHYEVRSPVGHHVEVPRDMDGIRCVN